MGENFPFFAPRSTIPQQSNYHDCGMFLLRYAEVLLRNIDEVTNLSYQEIQDKQWIRHILKSEAGSGFEKAEIDLKRAELIELLLALNVDFTEQVNLEKFLRRKIRREEKEKEKETENGETKDPSSKENEEK